MNNDKIKLLFSADTQVKVRNNNLYSVYSANLSDITNIAKTENVDAVVISGDLFEYCHPNEPEISLIYQFISSIVSIEKVKELVIMPGNHDLEKIKHKQNYTDDMGQTEHNALSLFVDVLAKLDDDKRNKIIYIDHSGLYESKFKDLIYLGYSLEDDKNVTQEVIDSIPEDKICICIFHDMIKEYVDSVKIPQRSDKYERLFSINQFPSDSLILAGDIHTNLRYEGENGQLFLYPGSPQQHTHNEGDFYTVSEEIVLDVEAAPKSVKLFDITPSMMNKDGELLRPFTYQDIELTDYVRYITIKLDSSTEWDIIKDRLTKLSEQDIYGKSKTYIKVKSSNIFLQHNSDIINIFQREGVFVSIIADKLISKINTETSNKVVSDIINRHDEDVDENGETINIDKKELSGELTNDDIIRMFEYVVDELSLKNDITAEVRADLINLFKNQLTNIGNISDKQYNISFKSIKCNQFMSLGEVDLNLDIPGITRILGTNGVGKTSLFRMIRWVLTGEAFKGMSKRATTANNLVVFNNNIPDNDEVVVELCFNINDSQVKVIRSASRKWKNNTTYSQKISIDKNKYVAAVDKNLKMIIVKDGQEKELTGDSVQMNIDSVFSDILDNIVFIDYPSLNSLINADPDDMENMCLRYIGLSFIDKLKNALPEVKEELMSSVTKPTQKLGDVVAAINQNELQRKQIDDDINNNQTSIDDIEKEVDKYGQSLESITDKMVAMGNIPNILVAKNSEHSELMDKMMSFEIREKKQLLPMPEQPIIDEEKVSNLKKEIDEFKVKTEDTNKLLLDVKKEYNDTVEAETQKLREKVANTINDTNEKKNARIKLLTQDYLMKSMDLGASLNTKLVDLNDKSNEITRLANIYLGKIINKINELHTSNIGIVDETIRLRKEILDNEEQIANSACSACGRPFDNHEEHAAKLRERNSQIEKELEVIEPKHIENLNNIKLLKNREDEIKTYIAENNFDELGKIKDCEKLVVEYNALKEEISAVRKEIGELKEPNIDEDEIIIDCNSKLEKLKNVDYSKIKLSEETLKINEKVEEISTSLNNDLLVLQEKEAVFNELNNQNTLIRNKYIEEVNRVNQENNAINIYNQEVDAYNASFQTTKTRIDILKKEIDELEKKRPEFDKLVKEKEIVLDQLAEYTKLLNNKNEFASKCSVMISELNHKHDELVKVKDNIIKYDNAQIVWSMYQTIINRKITDVVFEYYRIKINNVLNELLEDVDFKIFWAGPEQNLELYKIDVSDDGIVTYQLAKQSSGMEISFMGISLIYAIHIINSRNISHIFCDELSGALSDGSNIEYETQNFQELFVKILQKFKNKSTFIVDHNIKNLFETVTYTVYYGKEGNKIR